MRRMMVGVRGKLRTVEEVAEEENGNVKLIEMPIVFGGIDMQFEGL